MDKTIKILLVEDVHTDAELIEMELRDAGLSIEIEKVETKEAFIKGLKMFNPDIILSDYSLPKFSALEALKIKQESAPYVPLILVTGAQTEEIAVECIKKGADDYLLKSSLTRLPTSITNTLKKKTAERDNAMAFLKYRNLFENSLVGMFRASAKDCSFLEANDKAKSILGVDSVEGVKLNDMYLCPADEMLSVKFSNGVTSIENYEAQILKKDGTKSWISISAKLYEDSQVIEGVIHDITQTKTTFAELENANYELDRFVYHASHDMRSPLRSLEGLLQAILEEDSIQEIKTCAKMMQRATLKLDNLIEDLLVLARSKKSEPKITPIDFALELNESLGQLSFFENIEKINIQTKVDQYCSFHSDAVRLRIILNNLISNAIKYHRFDQVNPYILIDIQVKSTHAVISVTDNGIGIDQKHINKLCDMFYRANTNSEGSGLGLYLVKQTIEKLKGTINIQSQLNQGSSFIVEIPNLGIKANATEEVASENLA